MQIIDLGADEADPNRVRNISFTFNIDTEELMDGHSPEEEREFQYLKNGKFKHIDKLLWYPQDQAQRNAAWRRAKQTRYKEYNVATYNCEHFVKEVLTGKASSSQVNNAARHGLRVANSLFSGDNRGITWD